MSVAERCPACGFTPETRDRAAIWRDVAREMVEAAERSPGFFGLKSAMQGAKVHPHMHQSFVSEWNNSDTLDKLMASQDVRGLYACLLASTQEAS